MILPHSFYKINPQLVPTGFFIEFAGFPEMFQSVMVIFAFSLFNDAHPQGAVNYCRCQVVLFCQAFCCPLGGVMAELFKQLGINRGNMLGKFVPFFGFCTYFDEPGQRYILGFAKGFVMPAL